MTIFAISTAPSWCGIIERMKSTSTSPLISTAIAWCIAAFAATSAFDPAESSAATAIDPAANSATAEIT